MNWWLTIAQEYTAAYTMQTLKPLRNLEAMEINRMTLACLKRSSDTTVYISSFFGPTPRFFALLDQQHPLLRSVLVATRHGGYAAPQYFPNTILWEKTDRWNPRAVPYLELSIGTSFKGRWTISALEGVILNSSMVILAQSTVLLARFMVVHTLFNSLLNNKMPSPKSNSYIYIAPPILFNGLVLRAACHLRFGSRSTFSKPRLECVKFSVISERARFQKLKTSGSFAGRTVLIESHKRQTAEQPLSTIRRGYRRNF
jgi:hypothetical protein